MPRKNELLRVRPPWRISLAWVAVAFLATGAGGTAHAAMYKCVDGGTTIFQDKPCAGAGAAVTVKPAAPAPASEPSTDTGNGADHETIRKLRASTESMALERRQRELRHEIQLLEGEIDGHRAAMDRELSSLSAKKAYAKNNLAGATWEQSISSEMQAVAEKYKARIQIAQDRLSAVRKDLSDLVARK